MANIHNFLNRFQLQYRRTSTLHKFVIAAAVLLSALTLVSLRLCYWDAQEQLRTLKQEAAVLEQQNEALRQDIDALGTADSIRDIAREELGLVDPDTIIFEQAD